MDIHVINLDRCNDRRAAFEKINSPSRLNFSRFPGVDGKAVGRGELVEQGVIAVDLGYGDGALGNALSHLALWDQAIAKHQTVTLCEDDAIFNPGFSPIAESLLATIPPDWHVILWGWNFDAPVVFDMIPGVSPCLSMFDQDRMRMGIEAFQSARLAPQAFKLFNAFGVVSYSVSPAGAEAMKRHCLPLRNMNIPVPALGRAVPNRGIDVMLNSVYPRINAYVCFPPLVVTRNFHGTSTVQTAH